jgi:hypothetical protein
MEQHRRNASTQRGGYNINERAYNHRSLINSPAIKGRDQVALGAAAESDDPLGSG